MANSEVNSFTPFRFHCAGKSPLGTFQQLFLRGGEHLLGLRRCQQLYDKIPAETTDDFAAQALQQLNVTYRLSHSDQMRIPASGSCILIANHPYGGIEGLAIIDLLRKVRPDFKIMANFILERIPQLQSLLISVDPFNKESSAGRNIAPLRESLNWLRGGGLLVIFPAGEVSSRQAPGQEVTDPPWSPTLPRLVRMSKAPVLPVFFSGENGRIFQWAGQIHPYLRTMLLPRMLLNKRGKSLHIKVGNLLSKKKIAAFTGDQNLSAYLRLRTYALGLGCNGEPGCRENVTIPVQQTVIAAQDKTLLEAEIKALPPSQKLLSSGDYDVLVFSAEKGPHLLREIGRLRELTFRKAGEGTGLSVDLDRFDYEYHHLLLWNRERQELVGSYRIGRIDQLLNMVGVDGLYTSTLFDFKPELLDKLRNGLELGRSFVRPEYQRSYAPLLLLWKGIGHYLVANPQYRYLIGPVSISSDYSTHSRQLMTQTLARHYLVDDLANLVSPRLPIALKPLKICGFSADQSDSLLQDMENISTLVADIEADSKGIPVLLRHYLNLGGKLLAFNLDPDFSHVIDGLLLVDLQQTDRKQLQRYMGREGYQFYADRQHPSSAHCA
ncbi:GNAT family N-acyltransferase [uncultured Desulfuromusa sp.]|uniref:lysophospholipid acyltransferase family protein n=1 Tax=uncultured Desulfuromusa sp. TaxID=219183 RepID=UPI002AA8120B|nr:GNAT family N-acyltransferase [uncultured Desulfuromusa sp.]